MLTTIGQTIRDDTPDEARGVLKHREN